MDKGQEYISFLEQIQGANCISEYDGKPVKNHLPVEIKERLLTKNQWLAKGYQPKQDATIYAMHPTYMSKILCDYYLDTDVEPIPDDLECCATCKYRNKRTSYCIWVGDYVSVTASCSEYEKDTI